jgi:hypothetical protein
MNSQGATKGFYLPANQIKCNIKFDTMFSVRLQFFYFIFSLLHVKKQNSLFTKLFLFLMETTNPCVHGVTRMMELSQELQGASLKLPGPAQSAVYLLSG